MNMKANLSNLSRYEIKQYGVIEGTENTTDHREAGGRERKSI